MATNVQKALTRLQEAVHSGDAYEAQQVLKTSYYRLRAKQQAQAGYDLLQQAAAVQFSAGHFTCGLELAKLLLEAYKSDAVPATDDAVARLQALLSALPSAPDGDATSQAANTDAALAWAEAAIGWATRSGAQAEEVRDLHTFAANWLYGERGWRALGPVSRHFAAALNVDGLHSVLSDDFDPTKAHEWDLFVIRGVLQLLASAPAAPRSGAGAGAAAPARAAAAASETTELQRAHQAAAKQLLQRCEPDATQPEFAGVTAPLLNFSALLLEATEQRSARLIAALRQHYDRVLQRDPELSDLLDRVEEVYADVQRQDGMGGMLGGLMQMLGGGGQIAQ